MKEKPILMSAPMVKATLADLKTQTRRPINPQPTLTTPWKREDVPEGTEKYLPYGLRPDTPANRLILTPCPYGWPGDGLWVRENFRVLNATPAWESETESGTDGDDGAARVSYVADDAVRDIHDLSVRQDGVDESEQAMRFFQRYKIIPSIHMPRWASRINLDIADIRVERLQDISEDDAKAEGVPEEYTYRNITPKMLTSYSSLVNAERAVNPPILQSWVHGYHRLWDEINGTTGPKSWNANPWVWVVTFKRRQPAK